MLKLKTVFFENVFQKTKYVDQIVGLGIYFVQNAAIAISKR